MKVFVAWSVDHLDGLTASALAADNTEELRRISSDIRRATENVKAWAMAVGGSPILDLGPMGCVEVPADRMTELPAIAKKFEDICEGTLSVGVGMSIAEANTAMRYSSVQGGDQISLYTIEMEESLTEAEQPKQEDTLMSLGKSSQVGTHQPVGYDDEQEVQPENSSPQGDPQAGVGTPSEMQAPPPASAPAPASAGQGDPNGGQVQQDPQQGQEGQEEDPRSAVVNALMQIKQQAAVLEQLKQTNPQAFEAVKNVVAAMIMMAQGMAVDQGGQGGGEDVQKSEHLAKGDIIKFPGNPAPAKDQGKPAQVHQVVEPQTCEECVAAAHHALQTGKIESAIGPQAAQLFRAKHQVAATPETYRSAEQTQRMVAHQSLTKLIHVRHSFRKSEHLAKGDVVQMPGMAQRHMELGLAAHEAGNLHGAVKHYQNAVVSEPTNAAAHFNLGVAHYDMGDHAKALHHYEQAAALDPQDPDVHFNTAKAYLDVGDHARAAKHLRAYKGLLGGDGQAPTPPPAGGHLQVVKSEDLAKTTLPTVAPKIAPMATPKPAPQLHSTVDGFMGSLRALPKGSPERGKLITQHMNHGPFLSALQAHPQGKQVHAMLTQHLNGTANAGFKPGATKVTTAPAVKSELIPGVPHEESQGDEGGEKSTGAEECEESWEAGPDVEKVEYPVGQIKDGKVKVTHIDPQTHAPIGTGWKQALAGQVMSNDGHPISAREPNGK